jgi:nucleoside-diphosphate-sugar epimerase
MGRRLAHGLAARGEAIRVLCLPGDPEAPGLRAQGVEIVFGDVTRMESLPAALLGVDTVFHLAAVLISPGRPEVFDAVNSEGTRNLVAAAEASGTKHFIYVSSISVLYPKSNDYARSKLRGETWVRSSRIPAFTIIRPSLAYEDGGAEEFNRFVSHLRHGPFVPLPAGGRARKSPVHIDDLVSAFLLLPDNPVAFGKTYALTGGEILTLRRMAELLLGHMGRRKPILGVPAWMCLCGVAVFSVLSKLTGRKNPFTLQTYTGLIQDAVPDSDAAAKDLGYRPRAFRDGLPTLRSLRDCLRKDSAPPDSAARSDASVP